MFTALTLNDVTSNPVLQGQVGAQRRSYQQGMTNALTGLCRDCGTNGEILMSLLGYRLSLQTIQLPTQAYSINPSNAASLKMSASVMVFRSSMTATVTCVRGEHQ